MKKSFIVGLTAVLSVASCFLYSKELKVSVEAEGTGKTIEECKKSAYINAVRKATGVVIDSTADVTDDKLSSATIEASGAYVKEVRPLIHPIRRSNGLYYTKIKAVVITDSASKSRFSDSREKSAAVIGTGLGRNEKEAEKNALAQAIRKAAGLLSDSKTVMENDDVSESIIEASSAFIKSVEKIGMPRKTPDGSTEVKIKAEVVLSQLKKQISRFKKTSAETDIFGQIEASKKVEVQEENMMKFYRWVYPQIFKMHQIVDFQYKLDNGPGSSGKQNKVVFSYKIVENRQKRKDIEEKIDRILTKIGFVRKYGTKCYGGYKYGFAANSSSIIFDDQSPAGYENPNRLLILRAPQYRTRMKNYKYITDIMPAKDPLLVLKMLDQNGQVVYEQDYTRAFPSSQERIIPLYNCFSQEYVEGSGYSNDKKSLQTNLNAWQVKELPNFVTVIKPEMRTAKQIAFYFQWDSQSLPAVEAGRFPFDGESLFAETVSKGNYNQETGKLLVSLIEENMKQIKPTANCSYDRADPETAKVALTLQYDRRGYVNFFRQAKGQLSKLAVQCRNTRCPSHFVFHLAKFNADKLYGLAKFEAYHFDDSLKKIHNEVLKSQKNRKFFVKIRFLDEKDKLLQETLLPLPLRGSSGHYLEPVFHLPSLQNGLFTGFQQAPITYKIDIPFEIPEDLPKVKQLECSVVMKIENN